MLVSFFIIIPAVIFNLISRLIINCNKHSVYLIVIQRNDKIVLSVNLTKACRQALLVTLRKWQWTSKYVTRVQHWDFALNILLKSEFSIFYHDIVLFNVLNRIVFATVILTFKQWIKISFYKNLYLRSYFCIKKKLVSKRFF